MGNRCALTALTFPLLAAIVATAFTPTTNAQSSSGQLLGIQRVSNTCTAAGCQQALGTIDPSTGSIAAGNTILNFVGGLEAFDCVHSSAFDSGNNHYYFVFRDAVGPHLAEVDTRTGNVINSTDPASISTTPITPFPIRDLQFDPNTGVLLGIQVTPGVLGGRFTLGEIDPSTGSMNVIRSFVGSSEVSDCRYSSAFETMPLW
jgi:hypothetical protein